MEAVARAMNEEAESNGRERRKKRGERKGEILKMFSDLSEK